MQREIGNSADAASTDVGFHLIGHWFGGPVNKLDVVPGNGKPIGDRLANLNQGEYATMERMLRDAVLDKNITSVDVKIAPKYWSGNTSTRPDQFTVVTKTTDADGKTVELFYNFVNKQ